MVNCSLKTNGPFHLAFFLYRLVVRINSGTPMTVGHNHRTIGGRNIRLTTEKAETAAM